MINKILMVGLICLFIINCTTIGHLKVFVISPETQEEKDYFKRVWETPLDFKVPNDEEEFVWERIQTFIGKYSSVKIQVVTDYVVQTYNAEYEQFGYYVTRTPDISGTTFSMRCITIPEPPTPLMGIYDYSKQAELNAHILAYYALTDELMPKFIKQ